MQGSVYRKIGTNECGQIRRRGEEESDHAYLRLGRNAPMGGGRVYTDGNSLPPGGRGVTKKRGGGRVHGEQFPKGGIPKEASSAYHDISFHTTKSPPIKKRQKEKTGLCQYFRRTCGFRKEGGLGLERTGPIIFLEKKCPANESWGGYLGLISSWKLLQFYLLRKIYSGIREKTHFRGRESTSRKEKEGR